MAVGLRAEETNGVHALADAELERLYALHAQRVFRYCRGQLGGRGEAEDAMQTVFLHALRGLRKGVAPDVESAWLFTIAHNVCRTYWRTASRRRAEEHRDPQVLQEIVAQHEPDHDELFGLDDALARIPEGQRRAILLREWHGLSYREIAETLGTTQAAVEMLLFRARRSLAADLRGDRKLRLPKRVAGLGDLLSSLKIALGGSAAAKLAAAGAVVVALSAGGADVTPRDQPNQPRSQAAKVAHAAEPDAASVAPRGAVSRATAVRPLATSGLPRRGGGTGAATRGASPPAPLPVTPGPARSSPTAAPAHPAHDAAPAVSEASPQASTDAASQSAPPRRGSDPAGSPETPQVPATPAPPAVPEAPAADVPGVPDVPGAPPLPELPQTPGVPTPPSLP